MSLLTIGIKILHLDSKTKFLDRRLCVSKKVKMVLLVTEATLMGTNKIFNLFCLPIEVNFYPFFEHAAVRLESL